MKSQMPTIFSNFQCSVIPASAAAVALGVVLTGCTLEPVQYEPVRRVIMTRPDTSHIVVRHPADERSRREKISRLNDEGRDTGFMVSPPLRRITVTSPFGARRGYSAESGGPTRQHDGVDLRASVGTPVRAPRAGTVTTVGHAGGYGLTVVVNHGHGWSSLFGHLSEAKVRREQHVRRGELIGLTGESGTVTGPHLHWELRQEGRPLDPMKYIRP